jgi:hypothetical protein
MSILPHAVTSPDGPLVRSQAEIEQSGKLAGDLKDYVPSLAAVTAIRPAFRDELFPAERNAACAACACLGMYFNFIDEFHCFSQDEQCGEAAQQTTKARNDESQAFAICISECTLVRRIDRNFFPVATEPLKLYYTVYQCKECVVPAASDVNAGMDIGAMLPVYYVPRPDSFAAEFLAAKPLTV